MMLLVVIFHVGSHTNTPEPPAHILKQLFPYQQMILFKTFRKRDLECQGVIKDKTRFPHVHSLLPNWAFRASFPEPVSSLESLINAPPPANWRFLQGSYFELTQVQNIIIWFCYNYFSLIFQLYTSFKSYGACGFSNNSLMHA